MKKYLLLFSFLLSLTSLFAQPVNDDCDGLIDLGTAPICLAILDTFNNVAATSSMISSNPLFEVPVCFNGGIVERDVWFKFDVPTDGSIVDFQLTVTAVEGPNGAMLQPQVAVYRGECLVDELQELACASTLLGESEVILDLEGLTPGLEYFLRITDWSGSASANEGDFVLCIDELPVCFNLCDVNNESSQSCEGKLYDSGGPDGDYGNNENCTFTICPSEFHQCIFMNVVDYSTENNLDNLTFYAGMDTNAPQIFELSGTGTGFEVQASSNCVTIEFTSDGSVTDSGFYLEWTCSGDTCTQPPIISCDDPVNIPSLPYVGTDLSTCFAGNTVTNSPCNEFFINGEDYIFTYNSSGDECIMIDIKWSGVQTGVAIFNDCPNIASECIASAGGDFGVADPTINAAFLEEAGTYYILVANANNCTDFNINIETVDCPIVLPPSEDCDNALNINGCSNETPSIISVSQVPSTENNFQLGCWGTTGSNLFTWFIFEAQTAGDFGFLAGDANDLNNSDIDINVWGPFDANAEVCPGTLTDEPIRSTWSGIPGQTGLIDIHPVTGVAITDICEGAGGDKFVSTIPVLPGEWYAVLVLDFGGNIDEGLISMDFTLTDDGVLGLGENAFTVTADTAICPGELVQLIADGGEVYQWTLDPALSCINCPDPVATISETTNFEVSIFGACDADTLQVEVGVLQVDAGPDLTVCLNEEIQIVAGANFENVTYSWDGPAGTLSCTDCADPIVTAVNPGILIYTVTVTGPSCSFTDQMALEVIDSPAPAYTITEDTQICEGENVLLGGTDTGVDYQWTSFPAGLNSTAANPSVTPSESTTYILEVSNGLCPVPSFDSIFVEVSALPIAELAADVTICQSDSTQLSAMTQEAGVIYTWTPAGSLDDASSPSPIAFPIATTTYIVVADRNGCSNTETITVSVTQIAVEITVQDTFGICVGETINLAALANPSTDIVWITDDGSLDMLIGTNVIAAPSTATQYYATVEIDGCIRRDSVYIRVDSLPANLVIMPSDTMVCEGSPLLLTSTIYEPALYQDIVFQWSPPFGFQTPDSLFNMSLIANETTVYQRISTNGFCSDTSFVNVEVIEAGAIMIDPVDPVCAGETIQLMANTDLPGTLVWSGTGLSCTDCPNPMATTQIGMTSATYEVELEGFECPVMSSITIPLADAPTASLADVDICPDEMATLNAGGNASFTYSWFSPNDNDFGGSSDPSPSVMPMQTSEYFVTVTNGNCPDFIDSMTVFVNLEVPPQAPANITICTGVTGQLDFDLSDGGNVVWSPGEGLSCTACPNPIVDIDVAETYEFIATFSNNCGVMQDYPVTVTVEEGIDITSLTADPTGVIYEGTIVNIASAVTGIEPFTYNWSTGGITSTITATPLLVDAQNIVEDTAVYSISLMVVDELGCTDTEIITFQLLEAILDEIPNAFTPNGDTNNDEFGLLITGENIEVRSFRIWNRWGKLVHDAKGPDHAWDGMVDGDPAAADVYIYRAEVVLADGTTFIKNGDVTLIR
jgi:gliding motility-associated-like protein